MPPLNIPGRHGWGAQATPLGACPLRLACVSAGAGRIAAPAATSFSPSFLNVMRHVFQPLHDSMRGDDLALWWSVCHGIGRQSRTAQAGCSGRCGSADAIEPAVQVWERPGEVAATAAVPMKLLPRWLERAKACGAGPQASLGHGVAGIERWRTWLPLAAARRCQPVAGPRPALCGLSSHVPARVIAWCRSWPRADGAVAARQSVPAGTGQTIPGCAPKPGPGGPHPWESASFRSTPRRCCRPDP